LHQGSKRVKEIQGFQRDQQIRVVKIFDPLGVDQGPFKVKSGREVRFQTEAMSFYTLMNKMNKNKKTNSKIIF
jgi:hypothetical protein